jgi:hypothetical protein
MTPNSPVTLRLISGFIMQRGNGFYMLCPRYRTFMPLFHRYLPDF